MQPMDSTTDLSENMPTMGAMYLTFTSMFGNTAFQIQPSQSGKVSNQFGTIPYFSLEASLYMQQITSPVQPTSMVSGQHTGQQNVSGAYTVTGAAGNVQVSIGNATGDTGVF